MKIIKKIKFWRLLVLAPVVIGVFFVLTSISRDNQPQPQQTSAKYLKYQDPTYGFSIEYPEAWEIRKNTQVFENGDVVAFGISGLTQKKNTELTDGAQVAIAKPFSISTDLTTWVKKYHDNKSKFSEILFGKNKYQEVYTCNSGCMTYFYTTVNGKVYGVAVFAQGPDKDKMVYENSTIYMVKSLKFIEGVNSPISKDQAVTKVRALPEVKEYLKRVPGGLVLVNGEEESSYSVQVYEIKDGHSATFNWYSVNKSTGMIEAQF